LSSQPRLSGRYDSLHDIAGHLAREQVRALANTACMMAVVHLGFSEHVEQSFLLAL
jgi:hypothetical protein